MKSNDLLRYTALGAVFATLFVPFVVANSLFFPFITGKAFAFRILVAIAVAAWGALALRDSRYAPTKSLLLYLSITFVVIIGAADFFAVNPSKAIWSNFERMEGWITILHLFLYFIVLGSLLNTEKLWKYFFNTSVLASVIMTLYGFLQISGRFEIHQSTVRVDGTLGNPIYMAVYMLINIFIALLLLLRARGKRYVQAMYAIIILLQGIILYSTATRGSLLGFIGGLLVTTFLIACFDRDHVWNRRIAGIALVVIMCVIGGFLIVKDSAFVQESGVLSRFASISLEDATTKGRFLIWNMAWKGFQEKPILGWGQEGFNYVFNKNYDPKMYQQEQWFDRAHNVFIDWLIAGGALGLLSYVALYISALYLLWKKKADDMPVAEKSVITGLFAGYAFHNIFVFDHLVSYILFFVILSYIHMRSGVTFSERVTGLWQERSRVLVPLLVVFVIFFGLFVNWQPLKANSSLIQAISLGKHKEGVVKNLEYFQESIGYDTVGKTEAREQLLSAFYSVNRAEVPQELKMKFFNEAVKEMELQIKETPDDARPYVIFGTFLSQVGASNEALIILKKAHELSPRKQTILFGLVDAYLVGGKPDEALKVAREAYELDTSFDEVAAVYLVVAVRAGDKKVEGEMRERLKDSSYIYDMRVLNTYMIAKNYPRVIETIKLLAKNNPKAAISTLQTLIAQDPAFAPEGNKLLKEIESYQAQ